MANEPNRAFSKEVVQWLKLDSPSLAINEMNIKTTLRFHLTPARMTTIKDTNNNKFWQRCGEKEILIYCWWERKLIQPLWKTVWRLLKNLKKDMP
jgi:hypothetical protein